MKDKRSIFSKLFVIILAIVIVAMAFLFIFHKEKPIKHLNIYSEAGYFIKSYDIEEGGTFSISFTHSVNKSPVTDFYKIDKENNIYLFKTVYYNYGAGVPTELENEENLTYGENGSMIIDGMDKKIDNLTYFLSEQSDHILTIIGKQVVSLWNDCGQNVTIKIRIED